MDLAVYETTAPTVLVATAADLGEWASRELDDRATVPVVDSQTDALDRLGSGDVDCLVVGETLADGDGVALIRAARERAADLPIVSAPQTGSAAGARDATAAGATDYLPVDLAEDGELARVVSDAVERYDERRQADRERNMFHELLSNTPLSVYFKDDEARHVCVSSEATAYRNESLIGKTDYELYREDIGEEQARQSYEDDRHVIEHAEPIVDKEERHVTHEGEVTWLRTTKVPWRDEDGDVVGLIGITRTVTEIKRRELELEQEKQRLEQFASFVSHDLRNPVNVAQGYLEHGIETGDEASLREVAHSLDRMDRMIDDLLHMATPEDDLEVQEWTDVREVVERTWAAVDSDAGTLRVAVPEGTRLVGTRGALRQVLENLFKNAVEYGSTSPRSRAREDADEHVDESVTVEVGLTETGFYVADDGPGIPEADRDRVFDYGYTTGGTGVGLAIVKEIADTNEWETTVTESAEGGARFEFRRCILEPPAVREVPLDDPLVLADESNVGDARPAGDAHRDGAGAWTVRGGGANVWAEVEEYYAVHGDVSGDFRLEGRIVSLESIHEYSKAGLFVSGHAETGAPLAIASVTASHGVETCWRGDPGDVIASTQFQHRSALPLWVRLDRVGDRITVYTSRDGEDWDVLDQSVVDLPEEVVVGALVSSHNEQRLCEATFDNVRAVPLEVVPDAADEAADPDAVDVTVDE